MAKRSQPSSAQPGVVAFTGHMMDKVGRVPPRYVPRFPRKMEAAVTQSIRARLKKLNARVGYCSAACGGDIIFIEQMLARRGEVHVVLPYEEELFIRDCIQIPGHFPPQEHFQENAGERKWLPRFRKMREQIASMTVLGKNRPQDNSMASDCCNRVVLGLGLLKAKSLATPLQLLALWDGWSGDAPGGARSTVKLADSLGIEVEYLQNLYPRKARDVIKAATPPPGISAAPSRPHLSQEPPQQICALLFADVLRFSDLDEAQLVGFLTGYLQPLANMIHKARHEGYGPLEYRTWGDGLFCAFDSMLKAGAFARDLQVLTRSGKWKVTGSAEDLKLRIALHAGPVYRIPDPLFPQDTFQGTNINFAARIEPATPPGEIYCSETFAALAAAEGVQDFVCEFVGKKTLPKLPDTYPLYILKPASGAKRKSRPAERSF